MIRGLSGIGLFSRVQQDIVRSQSRLAELNLKISKNRELLQPSDNITASGRVLRLQKLFERQGTYLNSISSGRSLLEQSDNILSQIDSGLIDMQTLALDLGDSGATTEMRLAGAESASQTLSSLVGLANSKIGKEFLFSGFPTDQDPFLYQGSEIIFFGDSNEIQGQISSNDFLGFTLDPNQVFGELSISKKGTANLNPRVDLGMGIDGHSVTGAGTTVTFTDSSLIGLSSSDLIGQEVYVSSGTNKGENGTITGFNTLTGLVTIDAADAFSSSFDTTSVFTISEKDPGTSLSDLNAGTGVELGSIKITTTEFTTGKEVDLSNAKTLTDVKVLIENISTRLSVTLNGSSNGLVVTDSNGSSITIASMNSLTTAEDLGIAGTNAGGVITGTDIDPLVTKNTKVTDLAGAVNDPIVLGSIHVLNGSREGDIDLSSASTVGDIIDLINTAKTSAGTPYYLEASINNAGTGIDVKSRISGVDFSISLSGAADFTAQDLGLLTMPGSTNLSDIRNGQGLDTASGDDFTIQAGGVDYGIDLSSASTVQDVVDAINAQTSGAVTASVDNVSGNTIDLSGVNLMVTAGTSNAAQQLGFSLGTMANSLSSSDFAALHADSLFSAIAELKTALQNDSQFDINQAADKIDTSFDSLLTGRSLLGGRILRLDFEQNYLEKSQLFLAEDISRDLDVDLTEAISELQAQQLALETTFITASQIMNLRITNFL
jgi:flagellar hook-associated protein 3 FlgL